MERMQFVLNEIIAERTRQETEWGVHEYQLWSDPVNGVEPGAPRARSMEIPEHVLFNKRFRAAKLVMKTAGWLDIIFQEFAEAVEAADENEARTALVRLAALAVNAVETIDRRRVQDIGSRLPGAPLLQTLHSVWTPAGECALGPNRPAMTIIPIAEFGCFQLTSRWRHTCGAPHETGSHWYYVDHRPADSKTDSQCATMRGELSDWIGFAGAIRGWPHDMHQDISSIADWRALWDAAITQACEDAGEPNRYRNQAWIVAPEAAALLAKHATNHMPAAFRQPMTKWADTYIEWARNSGVHYLEYNNT